MIRILGTIPKRVALGVSGGLDSMTILHFLVQGRREVDVVHVNHGTAHGNEAVGFVKEQCKFYGERVTFHCNHEEPYSNEIRTNQEAEWRNIRYQVFDSFTRYHRIPLITAHHLDDCVETWIFSALHGKPKTIPYQRNHVIRPFLLTSLFDLEAYAENNQVEYIDDPSNKDLSYMRNRIRENIVPEALVINPGLHKTVARIVKKRYNRLYGNQ